MVEKKYMKLKRNVVYKDADHELYCKSLFYDMFKHEITIEGEFTLYENSKKTTIYGVDLTSDDNFINIHIKKISKLILLAENNNGKEK